MHKLRCCYENMTTSKQETPTVIINSIVNSVGSVRKCTQFVHSDSSAGSLLKSFVCCAFYVTTLLRASLMVINFCKFC